VTCAIVKRGQEAGWHLGEQDDLPTDIRDIIAIYGFH